MSDLNQNIFDVVVIATMSAGKSTVINALIGQELLHSANEATTATITRFHDKDHKDHFSGKAYKKQGNLSNSSLTLIEQAEKLDSEKLKIWNASKEIDYIDIEGDIQALKSDDLELVIYDTPGPNNSQDNNHEKLTMEVIDDGNYGLILYVLNATQIGIDDDRYLLERVAKSLQKDQHKEILFLLNKADCLDPDKNESIHSVMKNVKNYLKNVGFKSPIIIPTSARNALLAEKIKNGAYLTRSERSIFANIQEELKSNTALDLLSASAVHYTLKKKVIDLYNKSKNNYSEMINIASGFKTIQLILSRKLKTKRTVKIIKSRKKGVKGRNLTKTKKTIVLNASRYSIQKNLTE